MYGYLLAYSIFKNVVLVKIFFNSPDISPVEKINKKTMNDGTFIIKNFRLIEITDKFLNNYEYVDLKILVDRKTFRKQTLRVGESYDDREILCYITKSRALEDIYLFDTKTTGIFNQYELDGKLCGITEYKKGKINGISKLFDNGKLIEESTYKNNKKCGICKIYKNDQIIYEYWNIIKLESWE